MYEAFYSLEDPPFVLTPDPRFLLRSKGHHEILAALLYGITMTITAILFFTLWMYGSRRLLRPDADPRVVSGITRSYLPGTPLYGGATLIAFLSATASLILFAAIALFYALSAALFGRRDSTVARTASSGDPPS